VFVQFLPKPGCEREVERALVRVLEASRKESGCVSIHVFGAVRDERAVLRPLHLAGRGRVTRHTALPHTVAFINDVSEPLDHPVHAIRTRLLH
jgi:quinol monooxygenase YgiN